MQMQALTKGLSGRLNCRGKVSMPLTIAAIFFLIVYVILVGWFSFQEPPRPAGKAEIRFNANTDALAKKVQGDFSKLSPAEQQKMNGLTMGHGAMVIKDYYKDPR